MSEAAIRQGRYRPTVIEGIVGAWFVLMFFSFALITLPNHRRASASVPTKPTETSAPLSQQADRELSPEPSPVRLTAPEEAPNTIHGHDIQYTLTLPPNWTTKTAVDDFDTLSSCKSSYVGVIAEEAQVGTSDVIAALARDRLKSKATDLYWSQPRQVELDGRTWMEFTVKCQMENIPVGYEFCVYSGREGTFQIVGFTTQNLFDRDAQRLRSVMQTFRFPGSNPTQSNVSGGYGQPLQCKNQSTPSLTCGGDFRFSVADCLSHNSSGFVVSAKGEFIGAE
ncbi:exported hypothetical protein [Verrucomicrobia bacterium]|nr:exported hypothetical protein [Verrucomicrobiota bacterium]